MRGREARRPRLALQALACSLVGLALLFNTLAARMPVAVPASTQQLLLPLPPRLPVSVQEVQEVQEADPPPRTHNEGVASGSAVGSRGARLPPIPISLIENLPQSKPLCSSAASNHPASCGIWVEGVAAVNEYSKRIDSLSSKITGRHPRCPSDDTSPIVVWLRDSGWGYWYIKEGGRPLDNLEECSVPCQGYASKTMDAETTAIVIDSDLLGKSPGGDRVHGIIALEAKPKGVHVHMPASLNRTEILVSFDRQSDVFVNMFFSWEKFSPPPYKPCGDPRLAQSHEEAFACLPPVPTKEEFEKRHFAASFITNCGYRPKDPGTYRAMFFKDLLAAIPNASMPLVHNWGACMRTHEEPIVKRLKRGVTNTYEGYHSKIKILSEYKFSFAFENAIRRDYVTEKLYESVLAGTIPVVWGAPEAGDFLPGGPDSYISALDFTSPAELARFLLDLAGDYERYRSYFAWRWDASKVNPLFYSMAAYSVHNRGKESFVCRVCETFKTRHCTVN